MLSDERWKLNLQTLFDIVVERVLRHEPVYLDGMAISVATWQGGHASQPPLDTKVRPHDEGEADMMQEEYHPSTDTIRVTNIRYTGYICCIG